MKNKTTVARLQTLSAVLFWGCSFIATKVVLRQISPATVVWMRFSIGLVILGAAGYLQKKIRRPSLKDLRYFALLGFIGISFHQFLQSNALLTADATTTAFIVSTAPVYLALLGWLVLREKLSLVRWGGILLATFGVVLVIARGDLSTLASGKFGSMGDLLVLISTILWAVYSVISHAGLRRFSALNMIFYVMLCGWIFTTIYLFSAGAGLGEIHLLKPDGWTGVIFLGIFCSGISFLFWYNGLQALPASQVGAFLYFEPLIAMVAAAIILGERMRILALAGGLIVLLGVWIVNREEKQGGQLLEGQIGD